MVVLCELSVASRIKQLQEKVSKTLARDSSNPLLVLVVVNVGCTGLQNDRVLEDNISFLVLTRMIRDSGEDSLDYILVPSCLKMKIILESKF